MMGALRRCKNLDDTFSRSATTRDSDGRTQKC